MLFANYNHFRDQRMRISILAVIILLAGVAGFAQEPRLKGVRVFPSEIPLGTREPTVGISAFNAPGDSIIQINGVNIPTLITRFQSGLRNLRGIVPSSLTASTGTLRVTVISASLKTVISEPMFITVKPAEQPASLVIETSQRTVRESEKLTLEVRLTNRANAPFYVPASVDPLEGGDSLNSAFHLEVRHPGEQVYTDPITIVGHVGPSYRPSEEELLQSGTIARLAPGETLVRTVTVSVNGLKREAGVSNVSKTAGEYLIRMRFEPRGVFGQADFGTKFLWERLFSNTVTLRILDR